MNDFLDQPVPVPSNLLQKVRSAVAEARDLEQVKADLAERVTNTNKALQKLYHETLPELFDQAQVQSLALQADGNSPAINAELKPFYKANIPAEWPAEQRQRAFDWLDANGSGDLIKTVVTVSFSKEERAKALELVARLETSGYAPTVKQDVHWGTLTAWLREQVEADRQPPLDVIGGTVSRVVTLKKGK